MYKKLFAAPLALSIALSAVAPTFAHAEEVTTTASESSTVTPIISFKGVATSNYDQSFTNVSYVKDGDKYKVTMNVDKLFTTFKLNGEEISLTADGDAQKVTFILADINETPTITIGYSVNGYNATHDFTFDFTPSKEEVVANFEAAAAALSYTVNGSIKDEAALKAATKELSYLTEAIKVAESLGEDTTVLKENAHYQKQQAVIAAGVTDDTSTVTPPTGNTTPEASAQTVDFDLLYKGEASSYKSMFGAATVKRVNDQYEVTVEVPTMLTKFDVNGATPTTVASTENFRTVQFTTDTLENIPVSIAYSAGSYEGKHDMALTLKYTSGGNSSVVTPPTTSNTTEENKEQATATSVVPVISFKDVPTASYNNSFTNVSYVKDGDKYKVTMNVDQLFTTFKVNGKDVALTADGEAQKAEFTLADINVNPTITIAYSAGGYNASHDFTFDFTPSVAEVTTAFEAALKALSYTADDAIKTKEDVTAAVKQISAVDGIIAAAQASSVDTATFKTNADYDKQVANVTAYKTPFITALTSAIAALSYTQAGSITTDEQLAAAQAQLKAATDAEAAATAAGLTARTEIATLENYANIAAQKAVVEAGVTKQEAAQTERSLEVKVSNVKGASDIVKVYGVQKGDTVRVYNTKGKVVATETATGEYVRFAGLNLGKVKGKVSATAQAADQQESAKATVAFKAEPVSKAIAKASVTVKNNKGKNDVVTVKGTVKGEKVRVYDANGKTLKTVTATGKTTKVSIKQLGKKAGKIQVARIQVGKHISTKTTVKFSKEK